MNSRGVALYLVLAILLLVVILANVSLSLISSQSKLSNHQAKRIQAYYAGQAGMNYALEMMRVGDAQWLTTTATGPLTLYMCREAGSAPCNPPNVTESSLPASIRYVKIDIALPDPATSLRTVNTTVNYTSD